MILDHELVELVACTPGTLITLGPTPKPKLMEVIADLLSLVAVHRSKMGFTLPLPVWSRGPVEAALLDSGYGGPVASHLDSATPATVWRRFLGGPAESIRPWSLYDLRTWSEALPPVSVTASTKLTP
jgi:hypothetical protein